MRFWKQCKDKEAQSYQQENQQDENQLILMGLDSLFPSDGEINAKRTLEESFKTAREKYRIVIEYRAVGFSCPLTVKEKINPFYIIKEYSVSELESILSGKMMSYLIKDDMSRWAVERAKEMLEKLGEKARVYIEKDGN